MVEHTSDKQSTGGTDMTLIYADPSRTPNASRLIHEPRSGRPGLARSRRPGPSRPAGTPVRYYGSGVAMSPAPHPRRPVHVGAPGGPAPGAGVIPLRPGLGAPLRRFVPR